VRTDPDPQGSRTALPSQLALWVDITDPHIDVGCPDDCRQCAAAIAIAEALQLRPGRSDASRPADVWVDEEMVCLPGVAVWATPAELRAFVVAFDSWHDGRGPCPKATGFWLPEPDLPGGTAWQAAVKRGLMPQRPDDDPVSKLAWLAAGAEVLDG
jgi:hypothetical protein